MSAQPEPILELPGDHGPTFDYDAETAAQGGIACVLHKRHAPANLTVEFHHVIPVAWQLFFEPPEPWPHEGRDPDGRGRLWDARTVPVCPTDHRNVHYLIVAMMKAPHGNDPAEALARITGHKGPTLDMAYEALTRFAEAGGDIVSLAAAGEWGQA